jgi:RNA polymerase sigma factor (sigma-70 family)
MDLAAFIDAYRGPLVGLIASWGAPWADAAEIAQDSFAEAWVRRDSCRDGRDDPEAFGRWLRGVALNQYRNWARGRRRARIITVEPASLANVAGPADPEDSELLDALRRAIARLPDRQREVVLMHYLEETSVNQVAVLLLTTPKAVEARLYQARRTLRRLLADARPARSLGGLILWL